MTLTPVSFHAQVELLRLFLDRRAQIIEGIERLLNCQKKPGEYQQDLALQSRLFKDCFFACDGISRDQALLRDQLEYAHWQSGFKPRANPGNDIIDAVQLLLRGFHFWQQTRWPGQKGRIRFAHTMFNVYLLRCLTLLNMRLWDEAAGSVSERLVQVQSVLNQLWSSSPADQPVLVRDARWLFPVAMSPTTDQLAGYFEVATRIADTFTEADRIETLKASVQTGGGHLRAQLRHLCVKKGVSLEDHSLVLLTRLSNALDISLLMEGLVTLMTAYEHALQSGDSTQRLALASAICEGLSPDPELFVNRLDLLGPYTMMEYLFITTDETGQAVYTPMGQRHLQLLQDYKTLVSRLAKPLYDDCQHSRPIAGGYSPYGALYGFASNLLELMAFKTLQLESVTHFTLEDVFTTGAADKRMWVNGWRNLPHIKPEVVKQYEYPEQFAEDIHCRIEQALQQRVANDEASAAVATGRLYIAAGDLQVDAKLSHIPELPLHYILSSDPEIVAAKRAEFKDQEDLLHCRLEGEFVCSYQTASGWVGISKDLLTEIVGAGKDARLAGLPKGAAAVLRLMCPKLLALG